MMHRIIGAVIIVLSIFGICFALWHLSDKLKTPKDERLWWGVDIVIQLFFYPVCILGVILGLHQFTV